MDAGRKRELEERVYAGQRLTYEDGVALFDSDDLIWLGRLAHRRRTGLHGDRVSFVANRSIDAAGDPARRAAELAGEGITELHVVSDPDLPWRRYPDILRAIKDAAPGVRLTAFTAADLHRFATAAGGPLEAVLDELIGAGLDALTGGGDLGVGPAGGPDRPWELWSAVHRLAHAKGLPTTAAVPFGHLEEPRHRVGQLLRLRELQEETGGFTSVTPVRQRVAGVGPTRASDNGGGAVDRARPTGTEPTGIEPTGTEPTGIEPASPADALRMIAVTRLLVDNVHHVSADWPTLGLSVAVLSLQFGADDLDTAGAEGRLPGEPLPDPVGRDDLVELISDAGFRPVERDSARAVLREYAAPPSLADRRSVPQQIWA
ncbi:MAG TPA: aminofutalosine synthase MqnE [Micromonosporaceae bacterium]